MASVSNRLPASVAILLIALVAAYVAIGALYAALTPAWQVPDEPAHYNYVRSLARGRRFPILEHGDYDQAYLDRLTSERFPAELSIKPLTYEDHQPPLYYLLATPVYLIFDGALLPIRLLSVFLGAALLMVAFGTVRTIFPQEPVLGVMVAGFIAFIPQHVAMTAGVNNDTLAELVVGGTLWALVLYLGGSYDQPWPVGLLVGTALLTKTTAYVVVGAAAAAVVLRWRRQEESWQWAAGQLAWVFIPALLLSGPWFIRNGLTYGWGDPLGLARHDAVVAGQPRSAEWLAIHGWVGLLRRMARTTFQSFWGQFGWMAVPLPARFYRVLLLLSVLLAVGFVVRLFRCRRTSPLPRLAVHRCLLLAVSAALTFAAFIWYNLTFVQHQGRYLFPALIPLATGAALGLETWSQVLPRRLRSPALILFFAALATLDVYCLFRIAIPNLTK
jgi:4-amino-4-deoxy-L-arabinose transferase-like glycosyltransferase